ncbi:hypothetical protein BT96DRAFT_1001848 [Gymnopus androsaceus JB14]|uniref:Uncharacterized protein n=1 Tax=Gymnopus androsaceus JB14 TaxID=1447944 RepID=A0A6A4GZK4_9AGAR|nr:hypothetical protein BT96DRAFT_1001848 [Gymnopus androsaceus JB14]
MSTVGSCSSSVSHLFSPSQNEIISNMPSSLSAALKKFGADGCFDLYATWPNLFDYPDHCTNQIVGKHNVSICGSGLLTCQCDGTMQPLKPFLVSSLPDYLAHCLSDETYLQQSVAATDMALHAICTGKEQIGVQSVFEVNFIKDFKGPDSKLFVDRGAKKCLAFSIHSDFFNPKGVTVHGATKSLGIIHSAGSIITRPKIFPKKMK